MWMLAWWLLSLIMTTTCCTESSGALPRCGLASRMVTDEDDFQEFPFMVSLQMTESDGSVQQHFCAGSIIGGHWILTAAHCIHQILDDGHWSKVRAVVGHRNRSSPAKILQLSEALVHPSFDPNTMNNDIALLRTGNSIHLDPIRYHVNSICLPDRNRSAESNNNKESAIVIGWRWMKPIRLKPWDHKKCTELYREQGSFAIANTTLCFSSAKHEQDSCKICDSGGPLFRIIQHRFHQLGIVSMGIGCGGRFPGVYTDVAYHVGWIESKIKKA